MAGSCWGSGCWPFSPGGISANSPLETGQLSLRRGQAGRGPTPPTHWTLEEPPCEAGLQPCLGQVTWEIPWSPGSLPLWPRVPVTALKPLQAPVLLSQFQSRSLLHVGKVGSMPASLLGQKTPTGLPQGHWPPSHLHSAPYPHPSPRCNLKAVTS